MDDPAGRDDAAATFYIQFQGSLVDGVVDIRKTGVTHNHDIEGV
jgi:hypothetical protein